MDTVQGTEIHSILLYDLHFEMGPSIYEIDHNSLKHRHRTLGIKKLKCV